MKMSMNRSFLNKRIFIKIQSYEFFIFGNEMKVMLKIYLSPGTVVHVCNPGREWGEGAEAGGGSRVPG
jgi:hypothetical protein